MNITRYEPWNVLSQFQRDLDKLFRSSLAEQGEQADSTIATSTWVPSVDIKEDKESFVIEADIPGVDPEDIEVSMENGVLTIRGERNLEKREEDKSYKRVERLHGTFYRRFSLPETADPEKISASGKNGVLQVRIPKREVAQPRRISVKS
jgi:HSP20 family protein